jgi:hypothetical protein
MRKSPPNECSVKGGACLVELLAVQVCKPPHGVSVAALAALQQEIRPRTNVPCSWATGARTWRGAPDERSGHPPAATPPPLPEPTLTTRSLQSDRHARPTGQRHIESGSQSARPARASVANVATPARGRKASAHRRAIGSGASAPPVERELSPPTSTGLMPWTRLRSPGRRPPGCRLAQRSRCGWTADQRLWRKARRASEGR